MDKNMHISILGTCVCRDIFGLHTDDGGYIIDRFVQSISPFSIVNSIKGKVDADETKKALISFDKIPNFYKKCMFLEYQGKVWSYLAEKKSDYLLMDLGCARYDLHSIRGGYFSPDMLDLTAKRNQTQLMKTVFGEIYVSDLEDPLEWEDEKFFSGLDIFIDNLKCIYPEEKIILLEIKPVYQFVFGDAVRCSSSTFEMYKKWEKRIDKAFIYVKRKLKKAHIIRFPITTVGNLRHKWGLNGLHYIDAYYDYALKAINIITSQHSDSVKENLEILLYDYTHILWEDYNKSIKFFIQAKEKERVRLNYMENYEQIFKYICSHEEIKQTLCQILKSKGIDNCAFFSITELTDYLIQAIGKEIDIKFLVENDFNTYRDIPCFARNENWPKTDVLLICEFSDSDKIKKKVDKLKDIKCFDIFELLEECIAYTKGSLSGRWKIDDFCIVNRNKEENFIQLSWKRNLSARGYIIEEYKKESAEWNRIARISDNSVTNYKLKKTFVKKRYFRIRLFVFDGNVPLYGDFSETVYME